VSVWTDIFLGVIAVATLTTSILQVGVLVAAGRLAMRLMRLADRLEREVKPLFAHLDAIGRDAARASALAAAQVETAMDSVQHAAGMPAREGAAILAGFRAALSTLRGTDGHRTRRGRGEDEDALFV
jgi:hypothetical protein